MYISHTISYTPDDKCEIRYNNVCVCVCVREREGVCMCACVCVRERERECVCVCECERERVCVRERERECQHFSHLARRQTRQDGTPKTKACILPCSTNRKFYGKKEKKIKKMTYPIGKHGKTEIRHWSS